MILPLLLAAAQVSAPPAGAAPVLARRFVVTLDGPASARTPRLFHWFGPSADALMPADLAGVTLVLLPLDVTGRAEPTDDAPGATRRREVGAAGAALELPRGMGTLYRVRRTDGAAVFEGLMHVPTDGVPRIAVEVPALPGGGDAIAPFVAVSADGRTVLAATAAAAGGDLIEVDLARRSRRSRTGLTPALDLAAESLFLGDGLAFAVAQDGVWRFDPSDDDQATRVGVLGAPPAVWTRHAAISANRRHGVVLAGATTTELLPYVFGPAGPAAPAATEPTAAAGAGYATDTTYGPFLALSDDGVTVGWRAETTPLGAMEPVHDIFVARAGQSAPPNSPSGDLLLLDTLNEIGRVLSVRVGAIAYFAGEPNDPSEGGLESADLFEATVNAAGAVDRLRNVTGTSGDLVPPFLSATAIPTLTPLRVDLVTPTVALVFEDDERRLGVVDLVGGGFVTVMPGVRETLWVEQVGADGAWCAGVELDTQNREYAVLGATSATAQPTILDLGTPTTVYDSVVADRRSGRVAVRRRDPGQHRALVVRPELGSAATAPQSAPFLTGPIGFVGADGIAFTQSTDPLGATGRQLVWREGTSAPVELAAPARPSILLR